MSAKAPNTTPSLIFKAVMAALPESVAVVGEPKEGARFAKLVRKSDKAQVDLSVEYEGGGSRLYRVYVTVPNSYSKEHRNYIKVETAEIEKTKLVLFWGVKVEAMFDLSKRVKERAHDEQAVELKARASAKAVRIALGLGENVCECVQSGIHRGSSWRPTLVIILPDLTEEQAIAILTAARQAGVELR